MSALTSSPPLVSERIANHLREGDLDAVAEVSPYVACLMPLLSALGWRSYGRDIVESLPHFSAHLDLVELRNMLAVLGYQSDRQDVRPMDIDASLLPCLFVGRNGDLYVLTDRRDGKLFYFDGQRRVHTSGTLAMRGSAYVFTETAESGEALSLIHI